MKKDYKNLIAQYPLLFSNPHHPESSNENEMYFCFECGLGWYSIIETACKLIYSDYSLADARLKYATDILNSSVEFDKNLFKSKEEFTEYYSNSIEKNTELIAKAKKELPYFTQIKEKFGRLRMYYSGGNERTNNIVDFAETMSNVTCEGCGFSMKSYNGSCERC